MGHRPENWLRQPDEFEARLHVHRFVLAQAIDSLEDLSDNLYRLERHLEM